VIEANDRTSPSGDDGTTGIRSQTWWIVSVAAVRALLTASLLVALYYVLPLDFEDANGSEVVRLAVGFLVFLGLLTWNLRSITQSDNPGLRALEGLFVAVPLFILLFASTYYLMSRGDEASFTSVLSRSDALYFTVTIFSTVGFGDISAQTESARLVVTGQIVLDLIILGLGARIILGAVQRGRERISTETDAEQSEKR
jgi:voltage-gated potassium channel